jgi:hypothetical protein
VPGALRQRPTDDGIDRRREPGERLSDGWGWILEVGAHQRRRDFPAERRRAGHALEEHAPERILVGAPVQRLALELLGCGVVEGAGEPGRAEGAVAVESPGETEVGEVDVAVVGDQHVARLDVAVDEAAGVRSVEGGGDLVDDRQRPVRIEPALHVERRPQVCPGDVSHGDERLALVLASFVDRDHVGVVERCRQS